MFVFGGKFYVDMVIEKYYNIVTTIFFKKVFKEYCK